MNKKDIETSFQTLKQTVPLLVKHNIPAVPTNYALWYTYVSNDSPTLNEELDQTLESGLPMSDLKTTELYRSYLAEKEEVDAWQLRQSMEAMLLELSQSMKDTREDTNDFKTVIDSSLDNLAKVEKEGLSVQEVMALVRNMVREVQAIRQSTISFSGSLQSAEKEIARLKSQLQESERAALYDALTGLCNRRYFDSEIEAKSTIDTLSLMMIYIDHFKKINDEHGHQMGDMVLKAVAKKLQNTCRDNAQVFRYGGEEFAVLCPDTDAKKTRHLAESMRRAVEKVAVKDRRTGQTLGDISVSIGVAQLQIKEKIPAFIDRTDKLLYQAKNLGRNRVMPMN